MGSCSGAGEMGLGTFFDGFCLFGFAGGGGGVEGFVFVFRHMGGWRVWINGRVMSGGGFAR